MKLPNAINITQPIIKKGPKGISAERFLLLFINDGATVANATKDEKKNNNWNTHPAKPKPYRR